MIDIVDTAFSYESELVVCSLLQDFSKDIGSSLKLTCIAHHAFFALRGGNVLTGEIKTLLIKNINFSKTTLVTVFHTLNQCITTSCAE